MVLDPLCANPDEEFFRVAALCLLREISGLLSTGVAVNSTIPAENAAVTTVPDSIADVQLLAVNADRKGAYFYNDSTATAHIKLGGAAGLADYTVKIAAQGFWSLPPGFTGAIHAIWSAASGGAMQVTELT